MPQENAPCYDLVILGAGPAGLEAALQAKKAGLSFLLIEKDDAGSLIQRTMGKKKFLHQYGRNTAAPKGDLAFPDRIIGEDLVRLWRAQAADLPFRPHTTARSVRRENGCFVVETDSETFCARNIILASGTFEHPRELGVAGEKNNPNLFYFFDYYTEYQNKKIIVVGGGNSAAETVCALAPENEITLVVREPDLAASVTDANRADVEKLARDGRVAIFFCATVRAIEPTRASIAQGEKTFDLPYDLLFVHIGFEKPLAFLSQIEKDVPGVFLVGALTGADSIIESANQAYDVLHQIAHGGHS